MKAIVLFCFLPLFALAGTKQLTGNARVDLLSASLTDSLPQTSSVMTQRVVYTAQLKSPALGGLLSLAVPGAGEYYSDRFVKSGIFFAIEVVAVTTAIIYNNKGNNKTTEFQNYADQHWSAVDYVAWINLNGAKYDQAGEANPSLVINPNTSLPPWQRIDFAAVNAWEAELHTEGFSHQLPQYGSQQYYELIGKYSQFKYGWDTYVDRNGVHTGDDGYDVTFIPQQMLNYAANRGKANDYYYTAEIATALIVANHVISALDGAWSTANYNKEVTSEMGMHLQEIGGGDLTLVTQLTVKVKL